MGDYDFCPECLKIKKKAKIDYILRPLAQLINQANKRNKNCNKLVKIREKMEKRLYKKL